MAADVEASEPDAGEPRLNPGAVQVLGTKWVPSASPVALSRGSFAMCHCQAGKDGHADNAMDRVALVLS